MLRLAKYFKPYLRLIAIALPHFKIIQSLIDRVNAVTHENLSGMMVIRVFNMQEFEEQQIDNANMDVTSVNIFVNRAIITMMPFITERLSQKWFQRILRRRISYDVWIDEQASNRWADKLCPV
ncbi:MAG: hypothetical protein WBW94_08190 [Anaerolineales bacterium]